MGSVPNSMASIGERIWNSAPRTAAKTLTWAPVLKSSRLSVPDSVEVTTPLGGDLCHFDFLPRTRYTVFANENSSTTACSGNVRGVINPKGYGLAAIPLSRISEARGAVAPWVWAVIGTALLFAAGGGLLVTRRSTGRRSGPPSGWPAPGP